MEPKCLTAERFVDRRMHISYRYVYSETEYFRPHNHDYFEVFLVLKGQVIHWVNGTETLLGKGDLVFIRPDDTHDYRLKDELPCSMLNLTFTAQTLEQLFTYLADGFPSQALLENPQPPTRKLSDRELSWFEGQMSMVRSIDPEDYTRIKTGLRVLLMRIFTKYFAELEAEEDEVPVWLERMCATMREGSNFAESTEFFFSLTDKTREHVSRSMKKYMGMTVTEYINALRLNYIANMLRNSNHRISHIIFESGFNNISWASELFKQRYGMTMRQFRSGKETE